MSVCVTVRTNKAVEPDDIFKSLVDSGEKIVVTSNEYPCLKFGNYQTALRGIEVNQEEGGLEVRVCSFASVEDYQLFAKTIVLLREMTGGNAYESDDDDRVIEDPLATFDNDWIETERESSFMVIKALSAQSGQHVTMYGLFAPFCIGPKVFEDFEIELRSEYNKDDMDNLQAYFRKIQWVLADKKDTSTRMLISSPSGKEDEGLTVSVIYISDGKVVDFDYISDARVLAIIDLDDSKKAPVLIPFDQAWKILPSEQFIRLDEHQFLKKDELTVDMVLGMMERAKRFQPDNLHYRPTFPGQGYDEAQKTVILMWNPAISSVKLDDINDSISRMRTADFNWSVWDYENARQNDRFYLVRVGDGNTGIVMSGVLDSQPYESRDWSGRGRRTFYMDMDPNVILNSDTTPMLTTEVLMKAIPTFDWTGGHSGRILSETEARKLEELWSEFLENHKDYVDGVNMDAIDLHFHR